MSYQVIARKWRPQTFEEVTGQEAVTRTLRNAVQYERLHHAYLFSGARGVGKTTTARLLAKALNCHKTDKPNPKPCSPNDADACASCKEIAEGRSIDVLEIDAASHTGIDDVRDTIIESINTNPARDRYKVFIIDEVHQLSKAAFNALLKTLEEPPPNVVFVMATTELHKVPDTILSRCQEFEFKTIALAKIFDSLKNIAGAEKVNISDAALKEIARAGEGSMRDAQSAFDQVISFSGEKIEVEDVVNALGIAGIDILLRTVKAIAEHTTLEAFEVVEDLISRGHDLRSFCRDLLSFFRDLLVAKVAGNSEALLESAAISAADLKKQAEQFSEADLLRFFNSLADTEAQLRTATQPRYILEIGLVKLMEMRRVAPIEKLLEHLSALQNGSGETTQSASSASAASGASGGQNTASAEKKTEFLDGLLKSDNEDPRENTVSPEPPPVAAADKSEIKPETKVEPKTEPASPFSFTPVFSQPPPSSVTAYAAAPATTVIAPHLTSEDFAHIEDTWLDNAYERALLRAGDDFTVVLTLDLSSLIQTSPAPPSFAPPPDRSVPPPQPVEAQTPPNPAPEKPPVVSPVAAPVIAQRPVQNGATKNLLSKFRASLNRKDKAWLARAFDEISRIQTGESEIVLFLPESAEYWGAILQTEENIAVIRETALELLEKDLSPVISIEGRNMRLDVPSNAEIDKKREAEPAAWQAAQDDPAVKQVLNVFRGIIIDVSKTSSE